MVSSDSSYSTELRSSDNHDEISIVCYYEWHVIVLASWWVCLGFVKNSCGGGMRCEEGNMNGEKLVAVKGMFVSFLRFEFGLAHLICRNKRFSVVISRSYCVI